MLKYFVFLCFLQIMFASKTFGVARLLSRNTALWRRSICSPAMRTTLFRQKASIQIRAFSSAVEKEKNAVKEAKESAKEGLVNGSKPKISAIQANVAGFTIGFVASALGSMVGLGGGFIIIPLLTAFGGLTQHQAASCSLASICVNAIVGTGTYISQGLIDVPAAVVITATSMIMARYGSKWSHNFESKKLKRYYGWLCLIVAPLLPLKTRIMQKRKEEEAQQAVQQTEDLAEENAKMGYRDCLSKEAMMNSEVVEHTPLLLSLGLVAGTMSGFFGVGGGIIVSPSLCLFTQMAPKKIMGTSLVGLLCSLYL